MEIEVKQSDGAFVKAIVKSITPEHLEVTYEGGWKPDEKVEYENSRVSKFPNKKSTTNANFKSGDEIEACLKQAENEVHQWKKAKIREVKGTFAVVETLSEPKQTEIVSYDCCRPADSTTPLTFDKLQQYPIKVDGDLREYFKKPESFQDLIDAVGNIHVEFNEETPELVVWSYLEPAIRKVKVLKDFFISDSKRKLSLLHRQEEANKLDDGLDNGPSFHEEFLVPNDLTGLVIGKRGVNLQNARGIEGIRKIELDESRSKTHCYVKIYADTTDAIEQARLMVEFVYGKVKVPRNLAGKIIGKNGDKIQEIVDKSGVIRVNIADPDSGPDEQDAVEFVFTGTKETVTLAELLVNYQLKHNRELDELREEIERKLPPKPSPIRRRGNSYGRGGGGGRRGRVESDDLIKREPERNRLPSFRGRGRPRRGFNGRRFEGQRSRATEGRKNSQQSEKSVASDGSTKKLNGGGGGARRRRVESQATEG